MSAWLHEGRADVSPSEFQSDLERQLEAVVISRLRRELNQFSGLDVKSCCHEICRRVEERLDGRKAAHIRLHTPNESPAELKPQKWQPIHLLRRNPVRTEMRHQSFRSAPSVQVSLRAAVNHNGFPAPIDIASRTEDQIGVVLALQDRPTEYDLIVEATFPSSELPALCATIRPIHHDPGESRMRYLYGVARNTLSEYGREERPIDAVALDGVPGFHHGTTEWESREDVLQLRNVLNGCTKQEREMLDLYVVKGYQWSEIAQMRGGNEGALAVQYFRLKQRLRSLLEGPSRGRSAIMKKPIRQQVK